jgi:lysylphosphatidylglycerol synthetase-like protein (DUF2156 family)
MFWYTLEKIRLNIYIRFRPHSCSLHTPLLFPSMTPSCPCTHAVAVRCAQRPDCLSHCERLFLPYYECGYRCHLSPQRGTNVASAYHNTLQLLILGEKEQKTNMQKILLFALKMLICYIMCSLKKILNVLLMVMLIIVLLIFECCMTFRSC